MEESDKQLRAESAFKDYLFTDQGIYEISFLASPWNRVVWLLFIPCWILAVAIFPPSPALTVADFVGFFALFFFGLYIGRFAVWVTNRRKRSFYEQLGANSPMGAPFAELIPWSTITSAKLKWRSKSRERFEFIAAGEKRVASVRQAGFERVTAILRDHLADRFTADG